MSRRFSWGVVLLAVLFALGAIGYNVYRNIHYFKELNAVPNKISLLDYKKLPELVHSWPGTRNILNKNNYIHGNEPVRHINWSGERLRIGLSFNRPDLEDNAKSRSAVLTYYPQFPANSSAPYAGIMNLTDTVLFVEIKTRGGIIGKGYQRSRVQLELSDDNGRKMRGPKLHVSDDGSPTYLILRPTIKEPIPTGSAMEGFDVSRVSSVNVHFILGRYPDGVSHFPAQGELYIDNIFVINNIKPIVNFFGQPNKQRITSDNINLSYKWRKIGWDKEETDFFVGVNYPWNNYGWDIGKNPYGEPANSGWSANEKKLRDNLGLIKSIGAGPVRIYLLFDLRTGLEYKDGKLVGFDRYVYKDIETIFRVAGESKVKIIPVLFDFGIADGKGAGVGEHPELIFSHEKYFFLADMMLPLLKEMEKWNKKYGEPVFALELMNEPDNMAALVIPEYFQALKSWFQDLTNIIHNETSFKVTLGSHSIIDMQRWWDGIDIDIHQFHFYKYMLHEHEKWPMNLERSQIKIPGPMFAGEFEPYDITKNLDTLKLLGYNGLLLWNWNHNDGFKLNEKQIREIAEWIEKERLIRKKVK